MTIREFSPSYGAASREYTTDLFGLASSRGSPSGRASPYREPASDEEESVSGFSKRRRMSSLSGLLVSESVEEPDRQLDKPAMNPLDYVSPSMDPLWVGEELEIGVSSDAPSQLVPMRVAAVSAALPKVEAPPASATHASMPIIGTKRKLEEKKSPPTETSTADRHRLIKQTCGTCLEEKTSRTWCSNPDDSTTKRCQACYQKARAKTPQTCGTCLQTKTSLQWYSNQRCKTCYDKARSATTVAAPKKTCGTCGGTKTSSWYTNPDDLTTQRCNSCYQKSRKMALKTLVGK